MSSRNYSNTAIPQALTGSGIAANATVVTVPVADTSSYPTVPFVLAIDRGLSNQEVMLCTAKASNSFTVTRAYDGTALQAHNPGAIVEHTAAALDYSEPNTFINTFDYSGDLIVGTSGGGYARLGLGASGTALTAGSATASWVQTVASGIVAPFAGASAPTGWLVCDGSAVSRTTYAALFSAIGTNWGAGDNSTTFNLPDLRARAPIGVNPASGGNSALSTRTLGTNGGSESVTLTSNNLPAHTHAVSDPGHVHSAGSGLQYWVHTPTAPGSAQVPAVTGSQYYTQAINNTVSATTGLTVGNNTTTNTAVASMSPFAVMNFIIKT